MRVVAGERFFPQQHYNEYSLRPTAIAIFTDLPFLKTRNMLGWQYDQVALGISSPYVIEKGHT